MFSAAGVRDAAVLGALDGTDSAGRERYSEDVGEQDDDETRSLNLSAVGSGARVRT
jgi:hypothetical protein